jgi:hypothetical protein
MTRTGFENPVAVYVICAGSGIKPPAHVGFRSALRREIR